MSFHEEFDLDDMPDYIKKFHYEFDDLFFDKVMFSLHKFPRDVVKQIMGIIYDLSIILNKDKVLLKDVLASFADVNDASGVRHSRRQLLKKPDVVQFLKQLMLLLSLLTNVEMSEITRRHGNLKNASAAERQIKGYRFLYNNEGNLTLQTKSKPKDMYLKSKQAQDVDDDEEGDFDPAPTSEYNPNMLDLAMKLTFLYNFYQDTEEQLEKQGLKLGPGNYSVNTELNFMNELLFSLFRFLWLYSNHDRNFLQKKFLKREYKDILLMNKNVNAPPKNKCRLRRSAIEGPKWSLDKSTLMDLFDRFNEVCQRQINPYYHIWSENSRGYECAYFLQRRGGCPPFGNKILNFLICHAFQGNEFHEYFETLYSITKAEDIGKNLKHKLIMIDVVCALGGGGLALIQHIRNYFETKGYYRNTKLVGMCLEATTSEVADGYEKVGFNRLFPTREFRDENGQYAWKNVSETFGLIPMVLYFSAPQGNGSPTGVEQYDRNKYDPKNKSPRNPKYAAIQPAA